MDAFRACRCFTPASTSSRPPAAFLKAAPGRLLHSSTRRRGAARDDVLRSQDDAALRSRVDGTVLRSQDDAPVSPAEEVGLLKAMQNMEVDEPALEKSAEWGAAYVAAAVLFGAGIWGTLGPDKGAEYFAGYLLEQSLSIDNLFVFILVFGYFKTPLEYQNKVLTYGIATAAVLRLVFIGLGVEIVESFAPVLLLFAGILVYSSYKILLRDNEDDEEEDLADNKIVKFCRSLFTISDSYDGNKFFTEKDGVRMATPLLLVLLIVELSDIVFAVDSIPAVFGVTLDPFIVYTSNIFAILSLRGLYGFVAGVIGKMKYLESAVGVVLGFVGVKIVLDFVGMKIPTEASLGIVAGTLAIGAAASLLTAPSGEEVAEDTDR